MRQRLKAFIARNRSNRLVARVAQLCRSVDQAYENVNYDPLSNGETRVMRIIGRLSRPKILFDVGANIGDWADTAATACPDAKVYAFEAIPTTFEKLRRRFETQSNVGVYNVGLSDKEGTQEFYYCESRSDLASAVQGVHGGALNDQRVSVAVLRGDTFCAQQGIKQIDFLKIDVEGWEPQVLAGFDRLLAAGAIPALQFEYNIVNIRTHFLLADFYRLLEPYGYRIGKIFPREVEFRRYDYRHEDFLGPNYLAVAASNSELITALSRPSDG